MGEGRRIGPAVQTSEADGLFRRGGESGDGKHRATRLKGGREPMDWFERLTGFREESYEATRAKLRVEGTGYRTVQIGFHIG
jgi:hypothetical protein